MNFIKTTIATAAVLTCCLANTYPANAELSRNEQLAFTAGQSYGYALGIVANACLLYADGSISKSRLWRNVKVASELKNTTPAIRKQVVQTITDNSSGKHRACVPVVQRVLNADIQPSNGYSRADNWY